MPGTKLRNHFKTMDLSFVANMPKRKRDEQGGADRSNGKPSVEERLSLKVFHCRRVLQRSLKLAKGFERQKLGRRRKTALQTNTENDVKRIDGEIEALKVWLTHDSYRHAMMLIQRLLIQDRASQIDS